MGEWLRRIGGTKLQRCEGNDQYSDSKICTSKRGELRNADNVERSRRKRNRHQVLLLCYRVSGEGFP